MSANRIEALAKALYENGNPQHTAEDRAMLGPFEELDLLQQTIWIDLANAAHNHLTQAGEGTTDAGLVDLIAAEIARHQLDFGAMWHDDIRACTCGERVEEGYHSPHVASRVALLVEEQTNERSSARLREHVEELAARGLPADLNPTTLGDADYVWWSNYLRRIDQTVRSNARSALEGE